MKKVHLLWLLLVLAIAACNKTNNTKTTTPPGNNGKNDSTITIKDSAYVKNAEPYSFGLQARFALSNGDTMFRYGSFDDQSNATMAQFLMYKSPKSADSVAVAVLDETGDLAYMYTAKKGDSAKGRQLVEFTAVSDSELMVSLYDFDWKTNEGTMQKVAIHKIVNNKIVSSTYEQRGSKMKLDLLNNLMHRHFNISFGGRNIALRTTGTGRVGTVIKAMGQIAGGVLLAAGGYGVITSTGGLGTVLGYAIGYMGTTMALNGAQTLINMVIDQTLTSLNPDPYNNQVNNFPSTDNTVPVTFDPVSEDNVSISFYDNGTVDGDIIDVRINGVDQGQYTLAATEQTINLTLRPGINNVEIIPVSEGSSPPCTAAVSLAYGSQNQTITVSGYTGTTSSATIVHN